MAPSNDTLDASVNDFVSTIADGPATSLLKDVADGCSSVKSATETKRALSSTDYVDGENDLMHHCSSTEITEEESKDMSEIPVSPESIKENDPLQRALLPSPGSASLMDGVPDHGEDIYCKEVAPLEGVSSGRMCMNIKEELNVGDHVYQWRSWMGIPGIFQHHGIIMDIQYEDTVDKKDSGEIPDKVIAKLTIADFSNVEHRAPNQKIPDPVEQQRRRLSGLTQEGILRTYTDTDRWHKVEYKAPFWKRSVYRAGTCTATTSDAVGLVLARVNYILRHPDVLPDYHVVNANCECVAVWCKTGRWSTLQASSLLEFTAVGQVKSSATMAATAASAQVTVQAPAAGLWGWFGYTTATQVSWLSLHPVVIPALAGYAVLSVGVPTFMYVNARTQWKRTENQLKESFWEDAMTNPEVFAECITHWSSK